MRHAAIRLALSAGLCVASLPATAEVVQVQTGEHARFTRLAMVFESRPEWRAGRVDDGYAIAFDSDDLTLDLEGAFRLIPRDRVAAMDWDVGTGRLQIDSSCACYLDVFEEGGNVLVVDIRSGTPPPTARFEARLDGGDAQQAPLADADARRRSAQLAPGLDLQTRLLDDRAGPMLLPGFESMAESTPAPEAAADATAGPMQDVDRMEQTLMESLARAATDGLLSIGPTPDAAAGAQPEPTMRADLASHIESRGANETRRPIADPTADCPAPGAVNVAEWGHGSPAQTYAAGRDTLFDDLGRIDPDAVLARARALIHLGFGAEAVSHLEMISYRSRETDILHDLAQIVDHVPARQPRILGTVSHCPDASALWAMISGQDPATMQGVDAAAVQRSFISLPPHLQKLIGTDLVRALRAAQAPQQATAILDTLKRMPGHPASGLNALVGEDRLAQGDTRGGEAALGAVVQDHDDASPEALLTLLRAREARGATVPEDMLLLAESIAQELRGARMSDDLLDATARAHARDGRFEKAFDIATTLDGRPSIDSDDLRSDLAAKLADGAPDNAFLLLAFGQGLMLPKAGLSDTAALAMAARLLELGFAVEADNLIATVALATPETAVLRAEVALARGFPDLAIEHLGALDSAEAVTVRARARSAAGAPSEAADLYGSIADEGAAAAQAWAAGDDALIATHGQDSERTFIETVRTGPTGLPLAQQAALAREQISQENLRDLLQGTEAFRTAAESLLSQQRLGNE